MDADLSAEPSISRFLTGDYEYLTEGYYACEEAEGLHLPGLPTTADTLDAYVVPLALERVRLAGLPVPEWHLTNAAFEPPALLYGVNPFARNHEHVRAGDDVAAAARRVSRRGKFAVCCQQLPPDAAVVTFEQVFDRCPDERFAGWARALYALFHLPLARVRLIVTPEQDYFSAVERLPRDKRSPAADRLLHVCLETYDLHRA